MPDLRRCYGSGYLHFITFSCYRRLRLLGSASVTEAHLCQARFYDFVVFTVKEALGEVALHASESGETRTGAGSRAGWSSCRHYVLGERGPVLVNEALRAAMRVQVSRKDSSAA